MIGAGSRRVDAHRTRVNTMLGEAISGRGGVGSIVLISAPAGTGKSMVVRRWQDAVDASTVVVRWDVRTGIAEMWRRMRIRLLSSAPDVPEVYGGNNSGSIVPNSGGDESWVRLRLGQSAVRVVVIADDAETITDPVAIAELRDLLDGLPAGVGIILCGRFDPPLAWEAYARQGRFVRIGEQDLAMTSVEIAESLVSEGIKVTTTEAVRIRELTSGWISLVQSVAARLADGRAASSVLDEIEWSPRPIADLVVGDLIAELPAELRTVVCLTAALPRFDDKLATELCGPTAPTSLARLAERGFPLVPVADAPGPGYRTYPGVIRAHLRAELRREGARTEDDVLREAVGWSLAQRRDDDVLLLALALRDRDLLRDVLLAGGVRLVVAGRTDRLMPLLEDACRLLPGASAVILLRAMVAVEHSDFDTAQIHLEQVARSDQTDSEVERYLGQVLRADVALRRRVGDDPVGLIGALTSPPIDLMPEIRVLSLLALAELHSLLGHRTDAEGLLTEAMAVSRAWGLMLQRLRTQALQAVVAGHRGRVAVMRERAQQTIAEAREAGWSADRLVIRCTAMVANAQYLLGEPYDPPLTETTPSVVSWAGHAVWATGPGAALVLLVAQFRDSDRRFEIADQARVALTEMLRTERYPLPAMVLLPRVANMAAVVGHEEWIKSLVGRAEASFGRTPETVIATAIEQCAHGRFDAARTTLAPVLPKLDGAYVETAVTAWVLHAYVSAHCDDVHGTHRGLRESLIVAAPNRMVAQYVEAGAVIADALARDIGTFGHLDDFATHVLGVVRMHQVPDAAHLTPSEMRVLEFLPSGRTVDEIAAMLAVSVNTVKTHCRSVYRKLGVGTRRDAVTAARSAGLI
ncbi:LuxR C-terminal-related transcriptional regulator [Gordonia sp. ABSL1-1]|uniref:LuxR C-terminal-related transcriptional regulator n=1 Tax=Gordonia sp. ABSL1-1 TaxID=3053923 RepID=UPI002573EF2B|nr:LuxR C-terminal-related transcriptional regulator [Gordonia sp. ABSL1-1]MDL9937567.1 LuxR C-terminal-related transcriptional regulator [Gordonia sp. ABSL1-1]